MSGTLPASDRCAASTDAEVGFLGWRVVGAAFAAQFLSSGITFASFGVFVIPLSAEFDTPRGRLNLAFSLGFLVMGLTGPFVGHWIDRGYTRAVMLLGTVIASGGLFWLSVTTTLAEMTVVFCGIVALGASLIGMTPSTALVANWFIRRRGLALGIAVAGATAASFAGPPISAYLIDGIGWRGAVQCFGIATLAIGLPVFAGFAIGRPEQVGQRPDGDPDPPLDPEQPQHAAPEEMLDVKVLLRDSRLWLISVGFALVFTSPIVLLLSLIPFAEDLGISRQNATFFFSVGAPFSLAGKIAFGAMTDRIPPKPAIWAVVLGNALVWFLLSREPSYAVYLVTAAIYGLAIGATAPLNGVILGLCFGRVAFGRAAGLGGVASLPLIAGAPAMAGYLLDATGGYHAVFMLQIGLLLTGGSLLSFVKIPKHARS